MHAVTVDVEGAHPLQIYDVCPRGLLVTLMFNTHGLFTVVFSFPRPCHVNEKIFCSAQNDYNH